MGLSVCEFVLVDAVSMAARRGSGISPGAGVVDPYPLPNVNAGNLSLSSGTEASSLNY